MKFQERSLTEFGVIWFNRLQKFEKRILILHLEFGAAAMNSYDAMGPLNTADN
jgi:hypothetical protein